MPDVEARSRDREIDLELLLCDLDCLLPILSADEVLLDDLWETTGETVLP